MPNQITGIRIKTGDIAAPMIETFMAPINNVLLLFHDVNAIKDLREENERLIAENAQLKDWYQAAMRLQAENAQLKTLLNVKAEPQQTSITARILSDQNSAFARSLLIAVGAHDGVQKGQAVMASQGLIGRIIEVGENSARVLLIKDINSRVPVMIENNGRHAIAAGQGETIHITRLPKEITIPNNARIVTSGKGSMFPAGLPVGRVSSDGRTITPYADFDRLTHVRILSR